MPQKDPSRTEAATPKRIKKARGEGNVAKSQDFTSAIVILAGVSGLYFWLGFVADDMGRLFRYFFSDAVINFRATDADVIAMMPWLAIELAKILLPIMLIIAVSSYVTLRVQVGKLWSTKVFKPKLSRFNPMAGVKRMFLSLQTFIRLGKSLLQALAIGLAPWILIRGEMGTFATLYHTDAAGLTAYILKTSYTMALYALLPMIIIGIIDLIYTRWDYKENLKMTKQEVKDEYRQMDGDPQIKMRQKQEMMKVMRRRMMQNVPKADVVLTNPTHFAVALSYDAMLAPAPTVVAKGADRVAEKIKEIAREHRVPIRENKPLAQALYKQVEIGEMIPEDMYQAVATILAQIWKMQGGKQRKKP